MKKEYISPTIVEKDIYIQCFLHPVSGARTVTGLNNDRAGWEEENQIGVSNDGTDEIWQNNQSEFMD